MKKHNAVGMSRHIPSRRLKKDFSYNDPVQFYSRFSSMVLLLPENQNMLNIGTGNRPGYRYFQVGLESVSINFWTSSSSHALICSGIHVHNISGILG